MKPYGEWRYSSTILDLSTKWRLASFTPRSLYPRCQVDRRLGGPQSRSGRCEVGKILLSIPTEVSRLVSLKGNILKWWLCVTIMFETGVFILFLSTKFSKKSEKKLIISTPYYEIRMSRGYSWFSSGLPGKCQYSSSLLPLPFQFIVHLP
jgi:hypothetical protein